MRKGFISLIFLAFCSFLVAQQTMNNDAVIKLVKAGLSDDLIVSTINASPANFDTSTDGLIALKGAGASDKVVAAMVTKATAPAPAPAAAPAARPTSALPPGIDEVGIYLKDKSGNWVSLMPEIVNFKTGGFMKSMLTDGIVKGDINGHVVGGHAKTSVTFPVVFAVYVPEGTAITEYQLLRFRAHSNDREFRSVTGGVIHSSGGASRDTVEFQPVKLAPRLYQITLDVSAGKGEYGILPPGSYSSSNMASGGKMYSVSVIE
jgi:hypothetical protein